MYCSYSSSNNWTYKQNTWLVSVYCDKLEYNIFLITYSVDRSWQSSPSRKKEFVNVAENNVPNCFCAAEKKKELDISFPASDSENIVLLSHCRHHHIEVRYTVRYGLEGR